jgi:molecular chaperone HtpG
VSRELLQGSRVVDNICSSAVKRVLKLLEELADRDPVKYAAFWNEYGAVFKEGIPEDYSNRDIIARLLRFNSTKEGTGGEEVGLSDYVARMKDGQEKIYYLLAPSSGVSASSPHLEAFRKKGIEVLLLSDSIDDWVVAILKEFDGKQMQSVAAGTPDFGALDADEQQATENAATEFGALLTRLKEILVGRVHDVRISSRLTTSPTCIVANAPEADLGLLGQLLGGSGLPSEPVLEINPQHPLIDQLHGAPDDPQLARWANVLYDQAVLTFGAQIEDPTAFVNDLNSLLVAVAVQPGQAGGEAQGPAELTTPAERQANFG